MKRNSRKSKSSPSNSYSKKLRTVDQAKKDYSRRLLSAQSTHKKKSSPPTSSSNHPLLFQRAVERSLELIQAAVVDPNGTSYSKVESIYRKLCWIISKHRQAGQINLSQTHRYLERLGPSLTSRPDSTLKRAIPTDVERELREWKRFLERRPSLPLQPAPSAEHSVLLGDFTSDASATGVGITYDSQFYGFWKIRPGFWNQINQSLAVLEFTSILTSLSRDNQPLSSSLFALSTQKMNEQTTLSSPWHIAIVGGGPAGLTLSRILAVHGLSSTVYEAEEGQNARWSGGTLDLRPGTGRKAITEAHLDEEFETFCRYDGQEFHVLDHKANVLLSKAVPEGQPRDEASPEINRGDLRSLLLGGLDEESVLWGHKLSSAAEKKTEDGQVEYELEFTNGNRVVADLVVGADGTFSKTRTFLVDPKLPNYTGVTLVQLMISPDASVKETDRFPGINDIVGQGLGLANDSGKNLIFQRESHQMIRFYASQFLPEDAKIPDDVQEVKRWLLNDFKLWDTKFLNFLIKADNTKATPWKIYASDPDEKRDVKLGVQLIGDANKCYSPYAGEGANTALADATDLALILAKASSSLSRESNHSEKSQALLKAQQEFSEIQFPRAQAVARISAEGFAVTFNQSAQDRADQLKRLYF